ncbi:phage tail tip fiber protein, partial [Enterobacter hormaechei]
DVPYPQRKYQQMGLKAGQIFWYRAQLVDRSGNESGYTEWVRGQASIDVSDITDVILEEIKDSDTFKDLIENAVDSNEKIAGMADDIKQNADNLELQAQEIAKNAQDIGQVQTSVNELSSTVGDVSSSLSELEQTVATADTALGQRIDSISVSMDGMTGGVKNSAIAIIQNGLAQVTSRRSQTATNAGNSASIDRVDTTIADASQAVARALVTLDAEAGGNISNSTDLTETLADFTQASATKINTLTVKSGENSAAINVNAQAIADVNGNLSAMYNIKVGVTSNGQYYAAGMGIGVQNTPSGMQSQVIFLADRFAVTTQAGGTVTLPFVIQNGQTFINQAFIGNGWIQNAMIGDYIQSTTWDGTGNVGWHINKSGYAVFNNVTVRGGVYAQNGQFGFTNSTGGVTINNNGVTVNLSNGGRIVLGEF